MGKVEDGYNKADKVNCCRSVRRRHLQEMVRRRSQTQGGHSRIQGDRCRRSQIQDGVGIHPYKQDKNIELARQLGKVQDVDFVLA